MVTFLTVVHVFVCLFLILVVLLQAGKGGGMGIAFGGAGSQTVFGSSGAGNFLTRLTSITATVFLLTSLWLAHYSSRQDSKRLQELASQRATEKKSDDDKAAKLKADMEKIRATNAATGGKNTGATGTSPAGAAGASPAGAGPTLPANPLQLQLKQMNTPPDKNTTPPASAVPKPTGAQPATKGPAVRRRKPAASSAPPASGDVPAAAPEAPAPAAPAE